MGRSYKAGSSVGAPHGRDALEQVQKENGPKPAFPYAPWKVPAQYLLIVPSTSSAQALMPPVML